MRVEFDAAKSARNALQRGLPFERAAEFEWESAVYAEDRRKTYAEVRIVALGYLDDRLHVICFTPIPGGVRVISLCRANTREIQQYARQAAHQP